MRILIVTDAWYPQINGVVRTLDTVRAHLEGRGHQVKMVTPGQFKTLPCPTYPDIRLAVVRRKRIGRIIDRFMPSAIHIATEGPLGLHARAHCLRSNYPFTTAYHTRFPEYVAARAPISLALTYAFLRRFHRPSSAMMVATPTIETALRRRGFDNIRRWSRGVDTDLFRPRDKDFLDLPRPISLYTGRIAVEKGIEDFLDLPLPGTKVLVGDGPQRQQLARQYRDARFVGLKTGEDLARHYAAADVFVFPSRTDTFGLVLLEALASGVPVAAYPVAGPVDVIGNSPVGALDSDLGAAVRRALQIPAAACRVFAETYSWPASVDQFLDNIHVFHQITGHR